MNRKKYAFTKVGSLSSGKFKMQLNYYISPRQEKRAPPNISRYSEVYCPMKNRQRRYTGCDQEAMPTSFFHCQKRMASCRRSDVPLGS
jgi:hypothetical protein